MADRIYPRISDDSDSDNTNPAEVLTFEEKAGSIPGSAIATAAALCHHTAQGNPVVPRGPAKKSKKSKKPKTQLVLRPKRPQGPDGTTTPTPSKQQSSSVCTLL